jgi:hypothetical protein
LGERRGRREGRELVFGFLGFLVMRWFLWHNAYVIVGAFAGFFFFMDVSYGVVVMFFWARRGVVECGGRARSGRDRKILFVLWREGIYMYMILHPRPIITPARP